MGLIPWGNMRREIGDFWDNMPFVFGRGGPRVDVYQTEEEIIVKAEIPGVSKKDLKVFIDENTLRLSGQTKKDEHYKDENMFRSERAFGSFSRTIPLPAAVKSDEAQAEYKEGILSIKVPKVEPTKLKGRQVDIN